MSSIQSVERAMDILTLIAENGKGMGITEISKITNTHKSTVYRTVNSLCNKNYLYKDKATDDYFLGLNAFLMGFMAPENIPLAKISKPYMAFLSEKYQEYVTLSLFAQGHTVILSYYLGNYFTTFFNVSNQRGISTPYRPAIVYSMLAYQSSLDQNDPLLLDFKGGSLNRGPRTMEELISILAQVKKDGYAFEKEQFHPDEVCYAAPIFSRPDNAVATISMHGTTARMARFDHEDIIRDIKQFSNQISELWMEKLKEGYIDVI